jgi:hypothetical protein
VSGRDEEQQTQLTLWPSREPLVFLSVVFLSYLERYWLWMNWELKLRRPSWKFGGFGERPEWLIGLR